MVSRLFTFLVVCVLFLSVGQAMGQGQRIELTLDRAVDMAMETSYRVRQLELSVERTRNFLRSQRAALKSRVELDLITPEFEAIADRKWNSTLRRNEIVHENTRLWQTNLSVRQPVVVLGYPTNGTLSLNNRTYRYAQLNGGEDIRYYNRYYIEYEQPLFQPNALKNEIEEAELEFEAAELSFQDDIVNVLDDVADDYYDLFALAYKIESYSEYVDHLEQAYEAATVIAASDTSRGIERDQVQVELANARELVRAAQSNYRLEESRLKQRVDIDQVDSLIIDPDLEIIPIDVDAEQAIFYGKSLRPRLRQLENRKRQDELDLSSVRGWNSFRANLEVSYGRESEDPRFQNMWEEPTNSWSVGLRAYVPIWDWGRRRYRVQAEEISLRKTELYIEEAEKDIEADIHNSVRNLTEYQERALNMQDNLRIAHNISSQSLLRYRNGQITALDLLQSLVRERETAENFLDTYLGYRRALLSLVRATYYDFENDTPLLQRFGLMNAMP